VLWHCKNSGARKYIAIEKGDTHKPPRASTVVDSIGCTCTLQLHPALGDTATSRWILGAPATCGRVAPMHEQGLDHACTAEFVVHKLKLGTVHAQQKHATCPQCETWPAGSRQPGDVVGWWVGRQPLMKRFLTLTMIQRVHLVRYGYRITLLLHSGNKQHSALGERIDPVKNICYQV
jgi:hypothetical protein